MPQFKEVRFTTTIQVEEGVTLEALESAMGTFGRHLVVKPVYEVVGADSSALRKKTTVLFDGRARKLIVQDIGETEGEVLSPEDLGALRRDGCVISGGIVTGEETDQEEMIFNLLGDYSLKVDLDRYDQQRVEWVEREELIWVQIAHNCEHVPHQDREEGELVTFSDEANERINEAVAYMRDLQQKYGFSNDEDSALDAISNASDTLSLSLTSEEEAEACKRLIGR